MDSGRKYRARRQLKILSTTAPLPSSSIPKEEKFEGTQRNFCTEIRKYIFIYLEREIDKNSSDHCADYQNLQSYSIEDQASALLVNSIYW